MLNRFFHFLEEIVNEFSAPAVLFALSGAVAFGFLLALVLALAAPKREGWHFTLFSGAVALFELLFCVWHEDVSGVGPVLTFPLATAAAGYLFQLAIEAARKARLAARAKKEYRKVEKAIDTELKKPEEKAEIPAVPVRPPVRYVDEDFPLQRMERSVAGKAPDKDKLCLEHAAGVIEKLSYYDLSPADLKQVDELEPLLNQAEREGVTPANKERINDGLSELLKIMSKYAV